MTYQHCKPHCNNFGVCICCEQETCMDCWENIDSDHMNLDSGGQEALEDHEKEWGLEACGPCRECIYYAHDPEEDYDHNLIYKVEEYIGDPPEIPGWYGMKPNWKKRIKIIGRKPKPNFRIIRGPFILVPIKNSQEESQ